MIQFDCVVRLLADQVYVELDKPGLIFSHKVLVQTSFNFEQLAFVLPNATSLKYLKFKPTLLCD